MLKISFFRDLKNFNYESPVVANVLHGDPAFHLFVFFHKSCYNNDPILKKKIHHKGKFGWQHCFH